MNGWCYYWLLLLLIFIEWVVLLFLSLIVSVIDCYCYLFFLSGRCYYWLFLVVIYWVFIVNVIDFHWVGGANIYCYWVLLLLIFIEWLVLGRWLIPQKSSLEEEKASGKLELDLLLEKWILFVVTRNAIAFLFLSKIYFQNSCWSWNLSKLATVKNFNKHFRQSISIGFWQENLQRDFTIRNVRTTFLILQNFSRERDSYCKSWGILSATPAILWPWCSRQCKSYSTTRFPKEEYRGEESICHFFLGSGRLISFGIIYLKFNFCDKFRTNFSFLVKNKLVWKSFLSFSWSKNVRILICNKKTTR